MKRKLTPKWTDQESNADQLQREFERAHAEHVRLYQAYERAAKRRTDALASLDAARRLK